MSKGTKTRKEAVMGAATEIDTDVNANAATDSSDQKQRILEAALSVFAEKGFSKASVRAIAAKAGVTTGALYYYFSDKDEILAEATNAAIHYVRKLDDHDTTGSTKTTEEFYEEVKAATEARLKNVPRQKLQLMLASEVVTHEGADLEKHRTNYEQIVQKTADFFPTALGVDKGEDAYYLASILVAALDGMAFQTSLGMHADDMDRMASVFTDFFEKSIRDY